MVVTFVGDLHLAVDGPHLINSLDLRGESPVDAEYLAIDERPQRQIIESLIEVFPRGGASVLLDDLIVEPVDGGNLPGLVVAPQQEDLFGVFDLVAEEQLDGLHRVVAPVYEVPDEDVSVLRKLTSHLEQLEYVEELAVDVAADGHRRLRFLHIRLLEEQFLDLVAERPDCLLLKVLAVLQLRNPSIHLHLNSISIKQDVISRKIISAHRRLSAHLPPCLSFSPGRATPT